VVEKSERPFEAPPIKRGDIRGAFEITRRCDEIHEERFYQHGPGPYAGAASPGSMNAQSS